MAHDEIVVSVCIPVYNCALFIGEAIKSVLDQSFRQYELLIIDNKSTDGTLAVIKKFNDPRIRLIENDRNIGQAGNWDKCLLEARGMYIKLLPADDFIYPDCLKRQVGIFEDPKYPDVVLICCARDIIDEKGRKILTRRFGSCEGAINGVEAVRKTIRSGGNLIGEPGATLFKKEILDRTGRFPGYRDCVGDLELWSKILLNGSLYVFSESLCVFRISGVSSSSQILASQHREDFKNFIDKLYFKKEFQLTISDVLVGKFRATINSYARRIIYFALLRGK